MSAIKAILFLPLIYLVRLVWSVRRIQRCLSNIPAPKSVSIWTGNLPLLYDPKRGWPFVESVQNAGSVFRITAPIGCNDILYVTDPAALYSIFRKEDHIYEEPPEVIVIERVAFGAECIFATEGQKHRRQRKLLNPVFSTAHMKKMIPIFFGVSHKLQDALQILTADGAREIDMLHWITRTALELIGQAGIGHTFDSLTSDAKPNVYGNVLKEGVSALSSPALRLGLKYILPLVAGVGTTTSWNFFLDRVPIKNLQVARQWIAEMDQTSKDIYTMKKRALLAGDEAVTEQVAGGNDLMSILMRANMAADEEDRLDEEEVVSQISYVAPLNLVHTACRSMGPSRSFVFAATDTTSSALCRTLYVLAEHGWAQQRLRDEIVAAKMKCNGVLSYDELDTLPFLDAVCRETMRLYPSAPYVDRMAMKDTVLPLAFPITGRDGTKLKELFIPRGTVLTVSIAGTNRSAKIWGPDVLEWKPERWLNDLPKSVENAQIPGVYSNLMTFSGGKRACLGFKFSQLEMKVVLCDLVGAFTFSPTREHSNIVFAMSTIVSPTVGGKPAMPLMVSSL